MKKIGIFLSVAAFYAKYLRHKSDAYQRHIPKKTRKNVGTYAVLLIFKDGCLYHMQPSFYLTF